METCWAIAITRPNYEVRVEGYLARQGFQVYSPKISERVAINGRICHRQGPLFRRYIFVSLAHAWEAIARTFGVVGLLRGASLEPAVVPGSVIDQLKLRHNERGFVQLPRFHIGQSVRVLKGPFAGKLALYQGMSNKQRERVLLTALGCPLELTMGNLEAVSVV